MLPCMPGYTSEMVGRPGGGKERHEKALPEDFPLKELFKRHPYFSLEDCPVEDRPCFSKKKSPGRKVSSKPEGGDRVVRNPLRQEPMLT